MAFDMPLEADEPGEAGFFSSFVTTPVVGTLMWILGGDSEGENDEEDLSPSTKNNDKESLDNDPASATNTASKCRPTLASMPTESNSQSLYSLSKLVPSIAESDLSVSEDEGECSYCVDDFDLTAVQSQEFNNRIRKESSHKDLFKQNHSRKTSWSDESGQSLTEYFDEKGQHHKPIIDAQPTRSAMRRSGTSRLNEAMISHDDTKANVKQNFAPPAATSQHQFIPTGISASKGGIIMPRGGGMKSASVNGVNGGGYVSPQWGWYISTTPPSPEKYPSINTSSKMIKNNPLTEEKIGDNEYFAIEEESASLVQSHSPPPAPVFTKGLKGVGRTHMEWPSIPL